MILFICSLLLNLRATVVHSCTHECMYVSSVRTCLCLPDSFFNMRPCDLYDVSLWSVGLHLSVSPSNQHDLRAANIPAVFALVYLDASFFLHPEESMPPIPTVATGDGWG